MLSNSNTVTVAAAVISPPPDDSEQLTAEFSDVPAAQNGSDFTFKVTFTPEPVPSCRQDAQARVHRLERQDHQGLA